MSIFAQSAPDPAETQLPSFGLISFDEDWSALQNPALQKDWQDRIKYIQLREPGRYLSLGGEFRGTAERVQNDNWSSYPFSTNTFGLQRYMFHADAHLTLHFRVFTEFESGFEQARQGGPRPIDEKRLDFLNAFIDYKPSASERSLRLRVGKQELQFGAGKLISVRQGPNLRQGFFGFRLDKQIGDWSTTAFATKPAQDKPGYFDDGPDGSVSLWGAQSTHRWGKRQHYEINPYYYYGLGRASATFQQGTAPELRHSFGMRFVSDPPVQQEGRRFTTHVDLEAIGQLGSFGNDRIKAWSLSSETGLGFPSLLFSPRLGVHADASSGDNDPRDNRLQTFNSLFPNGNYFGIFADTGPGPVNFRDLRFDLLFTPVKSVLITLDDLLWWRQSLADGIYDVPGMLIVPAGRSQARFVGNRPGLEAYWQVNRHTYLQADYGVFLAGPFLRQSDRAHNLGYASLWVGYKF